VSECVNILLGFFAALNLPLSGDNAPQVDVPFDNRRCKDYYIADDN